MKPFAVFLSIFFYFSLVACAPQDAGMAAKSGTSATGRKEKWANDHYVPAVSHINPHDIVRETRPGGNSVNGYYTLVSPKQRWPSTEIPYKFEATSEFTADQEGIIIEAMDEISAETCLTFSAAVDGDNDYLSFQQLQSGCFAELGYGSGGARVVNVNSLDGCLDDTTTTIHEIMHALGFEHEQSRYDRDLYVEVQWDNIDATFKSNFDKLPRTYAFPQYNFDFGSVMMYTLDAFGKGGRPSMVLTPKASVTDEYEVGRATNMSASDIDRIFSAYGCYDDYEEPDFGRINGRTQRLTIF
ncbi:zinc metalloproteinase nas-13-like [Cloeon dipterum]|uniref:zinc metalloproteinase nas-13-like n=1 Tax=Cloeon dipterum TaxID=197152 RepID=UPI0032204DA6